MVFLKISITIIGMICKTLGEIFQHNFQRFVLPIVYSLSVSYVSHCWWIGLTTLPMIAPIDLGYKVFGPSDGFDRGMWLFLIMVVSGLGPVITGHLAWFIFIPGCIVAGVWGATTRGLWNVLIAPISGALITAFIYFIH